MFPLGTVLFPTLVLPLHVFEPRYRALVHDVLAGGREFGVCLIERGAEVGGGDIRSHWGTVAEVQQAAELPDGRWALVTVGTRRVRIDAWLADDPYPRAEVRDDPDPAPLPEELTELDEVVAALRRILAKQAELGEAPAPATVELADDPVMASHQVAALAPLGPLDQHALLGAPTVGLRLARLTTLLAEAEELLDLRLRRGAT